MIQNIYCIILYVKCITVVYTMRQTYEVDIMIETWLLENLLAFHECGTISAASEKLHITQPSVSRALQRLETELGVPLLERGKNKASLNDNGLLVADYAKRIVDIQNDMVRAVLAQEKAKHTISVGSCAPGPRLRLTTECATLFQGMNVEFMTSNDENYLLNGLRSNDFQLIVLSHPVNDSTLVSRFYMQEHLFINMNNMNPMAMSPGITFQEMAGQSFIMHAQVGIWENVLLEHVPNIKFYKDEDLASLSVLVNSSLLPSFSTDYTQRTMPTRWPNRSQVPITNPEATQKFYLVYSKKNNKKLQKMFNLIELDDEPAE